MFEKRKSFEFVNEEMRGPLAAEMAAMPGWCSRSSNPRARSEESRIAGLGLLNPADVLPVGSNDADFRRIKAIGKAGFLVVL